MHLMTFLLHNDQFAEAHLCCFKHSEHFFYDMMFGSRPLFADET